MISLRLYITPFFLSMIFFQSTAQSNATKPFVKVDGEVTMPLSLYAEDLAKMNQRTVSMKDHDGKEVAYKGVTVQEILERSGVTMGKELRKENLTKYLMVICADGYRVVFSLAELDSSFTGKSVILADIADGKPLSLKTGPFRLVVPDEKIHARSCHQVTELLVKFAKE